MVVPWIVWSRTWAWFYKARFSWRCIWQLASQGASEFLSGASRFPWERVCWASRVDPETIKMYTFRDFTLQTSCRRFQLLHCYFTASFGSEIEWSDRKCLHGSLVCLQQLPICTRRIWLRQPLHLLQLKWTMFNLTLPLPRVINVNYLSCGLARNITSHCVKNLAFHSLLRWKMITYLMKDDYIPHSFSSKHWENVLFELGSERPNVSCVRPQAECTAWSVCPCSAWQAPACVTILLSVGRGRTHVDPERILWRYCAGDHPSSELGKQIQPHLLPGDQWCLSIKM